MCVCACVCTCVRGSTPETILIASDMMWCDMNPYDWLNKSYNFCMTGIVGIDSMRGLAVKASH